MVGNSTFCICETSPTSATALLPQTNIVRQDGRRAVLVTVLKGGSASTLDVVSGIKTIAAQGSTDTTAAVEDPTAGGPIDLCARRH